MKPTPHALHVDPVKPEEQVHVQAVLPLFEVTELAWLLQWADVVHLVHVG